MLIEDERLCNDPRGISGRSLNVTLFSFAVFFVICLQTRIHQATKNCPQLWDRRERSGGRGSNGDGKKFLTIPIISYWWKNLCLWGYGPSEEIKCAMST